MKEWILSTIGRRILGIFVTITLVVMLWNGTSGLRNFAGLWASGVYITSTEIKQSCLDVPAGDACWQVATQDNNEYENHDLTTLLGKWVIKSNSGNIDTQLKNSAKSGHKMIVISDGWRFTRANMYPNIIWTWEINENSWSPILWNIFFFILKISLIAALYVSLQVLYTWAKMLWMWKVLRTPIYYPTVWAIGSWYGRHWRNPAKLQENAQSLLEKAGAKIIWEKNEAEEQEEAVVYEAKASGSPDSGNSRRFSLNPDEGTAEEAPRAGTSPETTSFGSDLDMPRPSDSSDDTSDKSS